MSTQPQPGHEMAVVADDAEALAFVDLYASASEPLRSRLGLRVERIADATVLIAAGIPSPMFNRAIGLGLRDEASAAHVDAISGEFRRAGCSSWWLHWNPYSSPAEFQSTIRGKGFTLAARRSWAKVVHSAEPAPAISTDLGVDIASDAQFDAVVQAIVTAFDMPPFMVEWIQCLRGRRGWRTYAVTDAGQVVGGGCLYSEGEMGWLGLGAVLPSHRRRGGQGALMARRIDDAVAAGARYVVTETGEPKDGEPNPSLANMKRCGFVTVASRLNFAAPA
jgi:hypothetical protein